MSKTQKVGSISVAQSSPRRDGDSVCPGEEHGLIFQTVVCYTAVFSVVTQRSSPHDTKKGCVADYPNSG